MTAAVPVITLLDSSGATLVTLTAANGYRLLVWEPQAKTKRRNAVTSPWVEGEFDATTPVGGARTGALSVRVEGSTWAQVEGRTVALLDVFDNATFSVSVLMGGVTTVWRCRASDSGSSFTPEDQATMTRTVNASVLLQPNPTITGV